MAAKCGARPYLRVRLERLPLSAPGPQDGSTAPRSSKDGSRRYRVGPSFAFAHRRGKSYHAAFLAELVGDRDTEFLNIRSVNAELGRPRFDHSAEYGQLTAVELCRLPTVERVQELPVERALNGLATFQRRSWEATNELPRALLAQDVDLIADSNGQHVQWLPQAGRPLTSRRRHTITSANTVAVRRATGRLPMRLRDPAARSIESVARS
jgi:hypothetical protein